MERGRDLARLDERRHASVQRRSQLARLLLLVHVMGELEVSMSLFDENAAILNRMKRDLSDLGRSQKIDFAHVFPDYAAAKAFAEAVGQNGFEVYVNKVDRDVDPCEVIATRHMVLSAEDITLSEERFAELAREQGGLSNSWGVRRC